MFTSHMQPCKNKKDGIEIQRGLTKRTNKLAQEAVESWYGYFYEIKGIYEDITEDMNYVHKAQMTADIYRRATPLIRDGELIVGGFLRTDDQVKGWEPHGNEDTLDQYIKTMSIPKYRQWAEEGFYSPQGRFNHKVFDFEAFIARGSLDIIDEAKHISENAKTPRQKEVADATIIMHECIIDVAHNYADVARKLAKETIGKRREELLEIARICDKVPAHCAESYHEALQSMWFYYLHSGDGVGRIDTIVAPYYYKDLENGIITRSHAQELAECYLIKVQGDTTQGRNNVSSVITMTLGGCLRDGSQGHHAVTDIFLDAVNSVRLARPSVYLRVGENTPDYLIQKGVTLLASGLGEPCFYGENAAVGGLVKLGVPIEEARNFALSGCAEIVIPGVNFGSPNGWINIAKIVDYVLRDIAQNGGNFNDVIKEIKEWFDKVSMMCGETIEYADKTATTNPVMSAFILECMENGEDIMLGGAKRMVGHFEGIGLPNAADMLYTAEKLWKNGEFELADLFEKLDQNDPLTVARIKKIPKFGSGDESADKYAVELVDMLYDSLINIRTTLRDCFVLGHLAGGENMHILYGKLLGATLDGRGAGMPFADSLAGSQSQVSSPTDAIRALLKLDHTKLAAGCVSTLRMPSVGQYETDILEKTAALIKVYAMQGGSQLQINMVDVETLKDAQKNPEEHEGLMIRVAGYCSDFTGLGKLVQDEIIARTENM